MTSSEKSTETSRIPLHEGASVGIIGAGPAGTFFALHLLSRLGGAGRSARITLIDRKSFGMHGPPGCNMCAGAIGTGMVRKMESMSLPLDARVVRRIADGYEFHGRGGSVTVRHPDRGSIYTVFRGGGPVNPHGQARSFDQFLLDAATQAGARFLHERVENVCRTPSGYRLDFPGGRSEGFDFLVGAFGVNTAVLTKLGIGYTPPRTWHTVQAEIPADNDFIVSRLMNRIHIVPAIGKGIRFLAITPKDDFLTLTGIGEHVRIADLERERTGNRILAGLLPADSRVLCHCHPQVPVGYGRRPFDDRLAIVGDAFISRYLKNGIESCHDTTRILADAVTDHGISRRALRDHYYRPCLRRYRSDNFFGRILFGLYESLLRKGRLSEAYLRSVGSEGEGRGVQARILWSVFAGDAPYREIAREALAPRALFELFKRHPAAGRAE